jgi:hypothetical protein
VGVLVAPGSVGLDVGLRVGVKVELVVVGEAVVDGETGGKVLRKNKFIVGALVGDGVVAVGDLGIMGPGTILDVGVSSNAELLVFLSPLLLEDATAADTVTIMAKSNTTTRHKMTTPERVETMRWNHDWVMVEVLAVPPFAAAAAAATFRLC